MYYGILQIERYDNLAYNIFQLYLDDNMHVHIFFHVLMSSHMGGDIQIDIHQ